MKATEHYKLSYPEMGDYRRNLPEQLEQAMTAIDTQMKAEEEERRSHAADKANPHGVTAEQAGAVPIGGGTMTGPLVLAGGPETGLQAATKAYVDSAVGGAGGAVTAEITIPHTGWQDGGGDDYRWTIDIPVPAATAAMAPVLTLHKAALGTAKAAGLCPVAETLSGALRLWAEREPEADMGATAALIAPKSDGGGGGGTVEEGEVATDDEVNEMFNDVFGF